MRKGPLNDQTDEQLMKLYQNGDDAAFEAIYERHSSKVYRFLRKRIGNKEKVAEIYQEVFIKIHKSKALYNDSFPVLPWIFTITNSVMIDELRKEKIVKTVGIETIEDMAVASSASFGNDALGMLKQLPDVQRQALEMRYINDHTFEQIAAQLKIQPSNARQVISRGIKRLRELVKDGSGDE